MQREYVWSYNKLRFCYAELSARQVRLLEALPKPGISTQLYKSAISATDLAALAAKTGDEFALFTLGSRRLVVRGSSILFFLSIQYYIWVAALGCLCATYLAFVNPILYKF